MTVVIPAYNPGPLLATTLDSVLDQTGLSLDIVVVDDGSTDGTPELLAGYGNRIRAFRIPNSGGPSTPRNVGVREARAPLIAFFDADDLMLPGKLAAAVSALGGAPDAGLYCTDFQGIDGQGAVIKARWLADYRRFRRRLLPTGTDSLGLLPAAEAFRQLLRANFVGTSSVVCRREALVAAGPFDEQMKNSDDRDMWFRIARAGWDFLFRDEVHHSYRKAEGVVTARGGQRNLAVIKGLVRQMPFVEDEADRRFLRTRIQELWRGYGFWLRREGRFTEARQAYAEALALGADLRSSIGRLRALLRV